MYSTLFRVDMKVIQGLQSVEQLKILHRMLFCNSGPKSEDLLSLQEDDSYASQPLETFH